MIGSDRAAAKPRATWLSQLSLHRYLGIDGGAGATFLADLAGRDPRLQQAASPRHADVLIIVEPISEKLAPALVTMARALVHPAHVLVVGEPEAGLENVAGSTLASLDDLFPACRRIPELSVEAVLAAIFHPEGLPELEIGAVQTQDPTTIQLPQEQEQEMATELAVLSLGPLQPFTAGPLRLFLICDGEQVFSMQTETGYAQRGIAEAMTQSGWQQGLMLARHFDPLAPLACQLVYVRALEQLQGWQPSREVILLRNAAVAIERVQNALWWLVRFARIVADAPLTNRSYQLAHDLTLFSPSIWQLPPSNWILPQQDVTDSVLKKRDAVVMNVRQIAADADGLRRDVERSRTLALRTRGIGVLKGERLRASGVASGPVLYASEHGAGDVQSRLVARLHAAVADLNEVIEAFTAQSAGLMHPASWSVPAGAAEATASGQRGDICLHLKSEDGSRPIRVVWTTPSAALLPLLPEVLSGQKLADAEVILASLDLSMAEVDG